MIRAYLLDFTSGPDVPDTDGEPGATLDTPEAGQPGFRLRMSDEVLRHMERLDERGQG